MSSSTRSPVAETCSAKFAPRSSSFSQYSLATCASASSVVQAGASSLTLEHAPDHRRAFFTSWTLTGTQGGQILAAMIFIPCRGGVSHHPDEWAEPAHVAAGATVLLDLLMQEAGILSNHGDER